jgi:hypothetical protein
LHVCIGETFGVENDGKCIALETFGRKDVYLLESAAIHESLPGR